MNIQDKLSEIEDKFAGTYKKELLDIWTQLRHIERLRLSAQEQFIKEIQDIWLYLHQQEKPDPILQVKLLHPDAKVPTRGSAGAIGWDLYLSYIVRSPFIILAGSYDIVDTGISVAIPHGYYGRVAPRSGLAAKQGINVLAGVIDSDYRGELKVILHNTTHNNIVIDQTKPIAQLILERADVGKLMVVDELQETLRGAGGFGSTDQVKETPHDPSHT